VPVRTMCFVICCVAILLSHVACNDTKTITSGGQSNRGGGDPGIQGKSVADGTNVRPAHGADPHFRIENGDPEVIEPNEPQAPKLELPRIFLSDEHEASCLVRQGDTMPDFKLNDIEGNNHSLSALLGDKATVVCFWTSTDALANWEISDLGPDLVERFGPRGLKVVGVNFKEPSETVAAVVGQHQITFPVLLDVDGEGFAMVATKYLPRTYVLDGDGKILWLDLGYTHETRRDLEQAVRYALETR